jgi:photosystem II stability/assembly factor-like uncharacterized protein
MRRRLVAVAGLAGFVVACPLAFADAPVSWVTDVNPSSVVINTGCCEEVDTPFSGRINALAVDPANPQIMFAGSELGGVYETGDAGAHWTHVDQVTMFQINDIAYVSTHPDVIIAAGDYDGRSPSQGGIWRSVNGGATWRKVPGSDPGCATTLVPAGETSAYRIAVAETKAGPPRIFVADDCGIATSDNFGATWSRIDPDPTPGRYWDVQATPLPNDKIQLDTCGDSGYLRSSDSGLPGTWTLPAPRPDSGSRLSPCRLAVAPGDPSTVFLTAQFTGQLWETTGTNAPWTWTPLFPVADVGVGRADDWVQTHPGLDGDPGQFEVYFYAGSLVHETCSTTAMPRCAPGGTPFQGWPVWGPGDFGSLEGPDADAAEIAFDPSRPNGCPIFETNDHGVFATGDGCDAQPSFSAVNSGLDPLWVWPGAVTGTALPDRTDLYFGTQDNGLFSSADTGADWLWQPGFDVFGLAANPTAPEQVAAVIPTGQLEGLGWWSGGPQGISFPGPIPPPPEPFGVLCAEGAFSNGNLTNFGPGNYAVISLGSSDCFNHLWVTTDSGQSWNEMGPPLPFSPEGSAAYFDPKEAGQTSAPTFYVQDCCGRLFKIAGPIDPSAGLTEVDNGLQRVDQGAFAVDPADPNLLYASDSGAGRMMVSHDGGASWQPDTILTTLITHNGGFPYTSLLGYSVARMFPLGQLGQPSAIAFDPAGQTVLVGTRTAGIFASLDGGVSWSEVPGSEQIPRAAGFFFDQRTGAIYVGSSGRGLWRISIPGRTGSS